jgi:hypothetical protein
VSDNYPLRGGKGRQGSALTNSSLFTFTHSTLYLALLPTFPCALRLVTEQERIFKAE